MKKTTVLGVLLALFLPLLLWVGVTNAQSFRTGNDASVPSGETVNSSVWLSGQNIDVAGTVDGDVFCAGMNIIITGTVRGDVLCAGQTVRIAGTIEGDVRVAGQTVTVGQEVQGNVSATAQNFNLEGSATIGGDLSAGATNAVLNGSVGRDAALAANSATLSGPIGRNVEASTDTLRLNSRANVGGNLTYNSNNEASVANSAQVEGRTTRNEVQSKDDRSFWAAGMAFILYALVSMLLLAVVLVLLFPRMFWRASDEAIESPLKVFAVGLVAVIVFPALVFALMITVIGIPLALLVVLIGLVVLTLSGPFFAFYVGRLLLKDRSAATVILVGGILVLLAYLIPVLGIFIMLLSHWMGTGMILLALWRRREYSRLERGSTDDTIATESK